MRNPMLEPRRIVVAAAVAFAALALATAAEPARGAMSVIDEQADASAVVAQTLDEIRFAAQPNRGHNDAMIFETTSSLDNRRAEWFPAIDGEEVDRDADESPTAAALLALAPSPMSTPGVQAVAQQPDVIPNEHAVIPLPPAAWTGLAGLLSLATIGGRKALQRFFCT